MLFRSSSGISGVVADAKRLIPNGDFIEPSLWIRSSQVSNSPTLISNWLENINYNDISTDINDIYSNSGINIITTSGKIEILGDFEAVSLYNISGYKVIDTKETIIDTEFLISGIYIAHIYNDNNTIIKKLYIEN